jgi:SAM-dependent methyltransferase
MTRTVEVARSFDAISPVYDETRDPLDPPTVDRLVERLRARGIRRILEIGVGTGRVALPLRERGIEVTGVDASWGMLGRARAKGVDRLVRGSAYHLPFADGALDAALFVHVLHVLDRPVDALREAIRVGRDGAVAIVHPVAPTDPSGGSRGDPARRRVAELLEAEGYPRTFRGGPGRRERELIAAAPPDRVTGLSDRAVTEPLARGLDTMAKRASRHLEGVPDDVLARVVARARAEMGDRTHTVRRVLALAEWERVPGPAPRPAVGPSAETGNRVSPLNRVEE